MTELRGFDLLVSIMRQLRAPGGCPWDAEQTHESLKRYLIEEAYEVVEAIDTGSPELLKEELGDLLLQPVFHAAIAEEKGLFAIDDVLEVINEKLVRRHPHVFAGQVIATAEEQVGNWENIKKGEKKDERKSALDGIPPHLPALMRAQKITEKAARVGFDWEHREHVEAKVFEELHELQEAMAAHDQVRIESELGDLIFAVVNLARFLKVDPEQALGKTIGRFTQRFNYIEERLGERQRQMKDATLDEMELLWQEAKSLEKN